MGGMGELFGSKYAEKPTHEQLQRYKQQALKEGYEKYDEVVDTIESGFAGTDPVTFAATLYD